jgi:hypothetical protein
LQGILADGSYATKFVSINLSAASATLLAALEGFAGNYYGGDNGVWLFSKSAWDQILVKIQRDWRAVIDLNEKTFLGYKYIVTNSLSNDVIVLGDFSQYGIAGRDILKSIDDSLAFDSYQRYFKATVRICGRPLWEGSVTLDDGSIVWPFVANVAAEQSSTSSSSSNSSSSSSTWELESSSSSSIDSPSSESSPSSGSSGSSGSSESQHSYP